jgi:hypothetical protein
MFVNLETTVLQELVNANAVTKWQSIASQFLATNDRNVAVGRIASVLQLHFYEQEKPLHPLVADLYEHALKRVDFYSIALGLIQAAEAADPSLIQADIDETLMAA